MILEDQETDQLLVKRQVSKYNPNSIFLIAEDKHTFLDKIDWFHPDLILADYNLPDYTGLDALVYIKEKKPSVPFVFVTGGLHRSDPLAEVILKLADGFVLKDKLSTLHTELSMIMDQMETKFKENREIANKENERRLELMKATLGLRSSGDFSKKDELMNQLLKKDKKK